MDRPLAMGYNPTVAPSFELFHRGQHIIERQRGERGGLAGQNVSVQTTVNCPLLSMMPAVGSCGIGHSVSCASHSSDAVMIAGVKRRQISRCRVTPHWPGATSRPRVSRRNKMIASFNRRRARLDRFACNSTRDFLAHSSLIPLAICQDALK